MEVGVEFPERGHVKDEGEEFGYGWLSRRVSEALKWPQPYS